MDHTRQSNLTRTLKALADPTRRAILQRLMRGEARVTELAHPFALSLNAVSKHIRVLERAHVVRRRRAGREHLLAIDPESLDEAASWIAAQRAIWTKRLDTLESILRAEDRMAAKTKGEVHLDERRARKARRQTKAGNR
jgi:DNA-binding transcriptional ArsR family regulator